MFDDEDTIPCPPPSGCYAPQGHNPGDFAARLMMVPANAGTRRETTWQRDHARDPRFNARGVR